ncbi:hypothetical protein JYK00_04785 [Thermosipho ferrireducens]|uniref:Polymer-forming cytoskeletal protein n=1 Tax=Thermosipho ferrireducens TaxID=2571116 RepID=A0ABX7SA41_9BACT|nr:hypothetical protein [Thermosipho ferrireducens]QTA38826.1 hypothetical protein JYK00_04785 [Thermosipho ferrireducens]
MDDIKKILEALERGEITKEEAEALIAAVKTGNTEAEKVIDFDEEEYKKWTGSKDVIGGKIVIDEGEVHEGDLNVVKGDVVVKGTIQGELSVVMGKLEFSGKVTKDANVVGSTVNWNGGIIEGDLNIVGCKESGKPPVVNGNLVRYNNAFIKGILSFFVKPFLSGLEVRNGKIFSKNYGLITNIMSGKKRRKKEIEELVVKEGEIYETEDELFAERIVVKGEFIGTNVEAEEIIISGNLKCGNVSTESLYLNEGAILKCGNISAEEIVVEENAKISCGNISSETINVNGKISAGYVNCEHIYGKGKVNAGFISAESNELKN